MVDKYRIVLYFSFLNRYATTLNAELVLVDTVYQEKIAEMFTTIMVILPLILIATYGRILLFNTENNQTMGRFDCLYSLQDEGTEIPYCQRLNETEELVRSKSECVNQGVKLFFDDLLKRGVDPGKVLSWSSSVELADRYAGFFLNRSSIEVDADHFICNCTTSGTFGKSCEYQLTHEAESFSESIDAQFGQKENDDPWNSQRYGSILCYETLLCNTGDLCLDWREICDGIQRCSSGIDEENCENLEFNECAADEFRCTNGMCIAEEFWLDGKWLLSKARVFRMKLIVLVGDYDCMDWSDELFLDNGEICPFYAASLYCDEHLCPSIMYSCGDGQCIEWSDRMVFQRFYPILDGCFNKRNLNYMCEASPNRPTWTLESGLCWPDRGYDDPQYLPWTRVNFSQLASDETCQYLFRCSLSNGFERDCPCGSQNCTSLMLTYCPKRSTRVLYPRKGLINGNVLFFHNLLRYRGSLNKEPHVELYGNIKCRGYHLINENTATVPFIPEAILNPRFNHELCTGKHLTTGRSDHLSSFQFDENCWNGSRTFNGQPYAVKLDACPYGRECISQYRIYDGFLDCLLNEDEERDFGKSYCTGSVGQSRFQCFNDEHRCLPLIFLGTQFSQCSNGFDEARYGLDYLFMRNMRCRGTDNSDCEDWQEYVRQSSSKNLSNSTVPNILQPDTPTDQIAFRSYCDSFWDLEEHIDEISSSCQYWVCQNHQYQCQTGQCIELDWVCDGEWDCADASDEEALVFIQRWSIHNDRLTGLNDRIKQCRQRYSKSPFSTICNTSFEFGCYQALVLNPLDIRLNRPCINLTQIGDGVENCYNAYDERNTFSVDGNKMSMWGFSFRCENYTALYPDSCDSHIRNKCTEILCPNHWHNVGECSGTKDMNCLLSRDCKKNARCDEKIDCQHGEDEYWCAPGSIRNQMLYRRGKDAIMKAGNSLYNFDSRFPTVPIISSDNQQVERNLTNDTKGPFPTMHSYQCNRGVSILEMNETRCLCPPAYYGQLCEFFSDRISIIANVDQKTLPKALRNDTLKLRATLYFDGITIDSHEFTVVPSAERIRRIKHIFYLVYSRADYRIAHKRWRYFNGTDVMNNHPYSVHLDAFSLEVNQVISEIGSWHYPVYFDFLPAFRMAILLKFPPWFGDETRHTSQQCNCSENATCQPVFNENHSHYCSCNSGFYGKDCALCDSVCEKYCSINALCRRDDYDSIQTSTINRFCICPLGHFGPRCHLKHNDCDSIPCLNSGTCHIIMDRSRERSYICTCSRQFHGNRCEQERSSVHIVLNITNTSFVRGTTVQLYHVEYPLTLVIQYAKVYHNLPSTISYGHADEYAPHLGVVKIYENSEDPKYFLVYVLQQSTINITSSPKHCPHASRALPKCELSDDSRFSVVMILIFSD